MTGMSNAPIIKPPLQVGDTVGDVTYLHRGVPHDTAAIIAQVREYWQQGSEYVACHKCAHGRQMWGEWFCVRSQPGKLPVEPVQDARGRGGSCGPEARHHLTINLTQRDGGHKR